MLLLALFLLGVVQSQNLCSQNYQYFNPLQGVCQSCQSNEKIDNYNCVCNSGSILTSSGCSQCAQTEILDLASNTCVLRCATCQGQCNGQNQFETTVDQQGNVLTTSQCITCATGSVKVKIVVNSITYYQCQQCSQYMVPDSQQSSCICDLTKTTQLGGSCISQAQYDQFNNKYKDLISLKNQAILLSGGVNF